MNITTATTHIITTTTLTTTKQAPGCSFITSLAIAAAAAAACQLAFGIQCSISMHGVVTKWGISLWNYLYCKMISDFVTTVMYTHYTWNSQLWMMYFGSRRWRLLTRGRYYSVSGILGFFRSSNHDSNVNILLLSWPAGKRARKRNLSSSHVDVYWAEANRQTCCWNACFLFFTELFFSVSLGTLSFHPLVSSSVAFLHPPPKDSSVYFSCLHFF